MPAPTHVLPLPVTDPVAAFGAVADDPVAAFLDSADSIGGRGRYAFIGAGPYDVLTCSADQGPDPFDALASELARHRMPTLEGLPPFQGGAMGILGYELGRRLERLPVPRAGGLPFPDMVVGFYDTVAAFDLERQQAWVIAVTARPGRPPPEERAAALAERLTAPPERPARSAENTNVTATWLPDQSRCAFEAKIRRTIDYINAGDIFQANVAQRFVTDLPEGLDPYGLYLRLRDLSPAPFAAYLGCGPGRAVVSASPERFLSLSPGGRIETRPIKGTRPRGEDDVADDRFADELRKSTKDRAENLMIVDLLRNDISRVARIGSVTAPKLFELETFSRVHHLVSEVDGELAPGLDAVDLLRATFPGGSITGAPKIRAMEIIHELEPVPRGPYCGAVIWAGFNGAMDSSIVIRTLTVSDGQVAAQAGGGIVADSDPAAEYDETLTKIAPLLATLDPERPH